MCSMQKLAHHKTVRFLVQNALELFSQMNTNENRSNFVALMLVQPLSLLVPPPTLLLAS
jgi:hypothetical protein